MPVLRKSYDELRAESTRLLEKSGKVTNLSDGGVAKSILDIASLEIAELYESLDFQTTMSRLSTAAGVFLDLIGQGRGLTRNGSIAAVVTREDEAIKFFSKDGLTPLKSILPSGKVSSGTLVTSSDAGITYSITEDVFPDDVQTELFVPAVSQSTGIDQNAGVGVLVVHNLGVGDVGVTNVETITSAADVESDSNYRFRISRSLASTAGATEDAIRLAAFAFPGVADVQLRPLANGAGTFDVIVIPVGNRFPAGTLRAIEALVRRVSPFGSRVAVKAPTELSVRLTVQLEFRREASAADRSQIREGVRQAVLRYLGDINVGGVFVVNELTQRVMDVSENIMDFRILLYRFRGVNQILKNVQAEGDEAFTPDDSVSNPIRVL